jgi:tetratricopeptide (TPR) repeat protein
MGIPEFVKKAEAKGIKPIAGCEFRENDELLYIGLAMNREGLKELNEWQTRHNLQNESYLANAPKFEHVYVIYPFGTKRPDQLAENEFTGIRATELNQLLRSEYRNNLQQLVVLHPVTFTDQKGWFLHKCLRAIDHNVLISKLETHQFASEAEIFVLPEWLNQAFNKYPEDQSILVQLINYYITTGKIEDAITYLDKAIAKEKDNPSFYLAKGIALDKLGRQDDAIKEYELAIKVKADYADAYYNIGVIYFNRGVKQFDVANAVPTNEQAKFEAEKKKSDDEFAKAVPFLEKAVEYNPKDTYIKDQLKNLYYRLKMMDKFESMNK